MSTAVLTGLSGIVSPGALAVVSNSHTLYSDGTSGFDPSAGPGFDTGPNNGIVRTNDTFTYNVSLTAAGVESGIVITATLPTVDGKAVAVWPALPAYCMAGGSSISVDRLTVTCALDTIGQAGSNTATDVLLTAQVLSTAANGTVIPAPQITVTSPQGVPASSTVPQPVTVSAAPFYDVVIQQSFQGSPQAYGYNTANGPANEDGFYSRPLIGLVAKHPNGHGNKGVEQLNPAQPIKVTLDLSQMPAGTIVDNYHQGAAPAGTPAATGSFLDGCGSPGSWGWNVITSDGNPSPENGGVVNMYEKVGDSGSATVTNDSMVPNGGNCQVTGTTSTSMSVEISGTDTTLVRRPTVYSGTNAPIPTTDWWVANKAVVLWTPLTSYPPNQQVWNTIKLGSFSATSISGQAMQNISTSNDSATYDLTSYNGGTALKVFVPDNSRPAPYATTADPAVTSDAHVNYMTAGQTVRTQVRYLNTGTYTQKDVFSCDIIDRTVFDIGPNFSARISVGTGSIQYGARAAGQSPYFASTDSADPSGLKIFGIADGTSEYNSETCQDPGIQWFNTPAEAEAAGGLVYVKATFPTVPGNTPAYFDITGLTLRSTYARTISTTYPSSVTHQQGDPVAADTLIRNLARVWNTSVPAVDSTKYTDHLQVVPMKTTSRVTKDIVAVNGSPALNPSAISPDALLTYQVQPRYSTTFPPQPSTVTVTDVLPPNTTYVAGSSTVGGTAKDPQVIPNSPAAGYTRLVWTYDQVLPYVGSDGSAANLPPVRFNVKVSNLAPNNSKIVNAVMVSAGASDYEPDTDCVYSTSAMNFGTCSKSATNSTTVQTTAGYRLQKSTPVTTIEPGQNFNFQISYASFGKPVTSTDIPDMIDVLPYLGDGVARTNFQGRSPSSSFTPGAYQLTSVTVPSNDPGMTVYYTKAAPSSVSNDPRDPSNALEGGSTIWCTQSQFGAAGCPTTIEETTAVRLRPGVTSFPADTVYTATLNLKSTANAKAKDLFNNSVGSRSLSGSLLLLEVQAQSPVQVVSSTLSGRVFMDVNQNKALDAGTDSPIAGVCVSVAGQTNSGVSVTYSVRTQSDGTYTFTSGAPDIYPTGDCSGTVLTSFGGLLSGTYTLTELQPAGYSDGADYAGPAGGQVTNDSITGIRLDVGQTAPDYVFTERPAGLNVSKKVSPVFVHVETDAQQPDTLTYSPADRQLVYTLSVTNPGATPLSDVTLTDMLPPQVSFVSATLDGAPLTPSRTSPLTLTLPTLAPNTTKDVLVTVEVQPLTPGVNQTPILNTVSAEASGIKPVSSEQARTDFVYTTLYKQVRNISRSADWASTSEGLPGETLEYCIDFRNLGTTTLANYSLVDKVPDHTAYVADSAQVFQGTMRSPGGAFPGMTAGYAASTNEVFAASQALEPSAQGSLCFKVTIK
ncbi:hypothetical protein GCM10017783_23130 [Deinococcus piscis]|uniref:DUF11 domain-containing protein n=1 Tax=Deinococcus piscis TaxID=394230 RepID=A0ABQ3KCX8_9DEIO|nr:DUF11 domain-containing protein [Deinococcus piscis]GHG10013.1 hypothetical protein GCM10017783_23130 [Deinococcus piscis]